MKDKETSKILGIIGLGVGWLIPLAGFVLGIIGLSIKKGSNSDRDVTLNVLSIVFAVLFWLMWIAILL